MEFKKKRCEFRIQNSWQDGSMHPDDEVDGNHAWIDASRVFKEMTGLAVLY